MPRLNQDLSDVKDEEMAERGPWRAIPDGEYVAEITKSDYKQTQARNGMVLKLEWEILEDAQRGKRLFDALTLQHPNDDTVRIARAKLKQLAIACNHPTPDFVGDSEELHGIPVLLKVTRERAKNAQFGDADGMQNRIIAYRPVSGSPAPRAKSAEEPPPLTDEEIPF